MATISRDEAEAFIYREARLIDEWRLDEWQALFTDDGRYWLPVTEDSDPDRDSTILCDDRQQMAMRIHQIMKRGHLAQVPRSRVTHIVSNIEIEESAVADEVVVRANAVVYELRPGDFQELATGIGETRALVTRCIYRLRANDGWKIAEKRVLLLDRDMPIYNLTFIL